MWTISDTMIIEGLSQESCSSVSQQSRTCRKSRALHPDSRQTDICSYLSAILLLGLGTNALFGWWRADPAAGLLMVPIISKEGVEALRGESCTCHSE
jgi:divalent metal cation (Fe/Co/Zn/Cd) transporter